MDQSVGTSLWCYLPNCGGFNCTIGYGYTFDMFIMTEVPYFCVQTLDNNEMLNKIFTKEKQMSTNNVIGNFTGIKKTKACWKNVGRVNENETKIDE